MNSQCVENLQCATQAGKINIKFIQIEKCQSSVMNFCDGILNFEPGIMLGRTLGVFILLGTVTPSVRERWGCLKNRLQKWISNVEYFWEIVYEHEFL